jgi:O-antigen ligase
MNQELPNGSPMWHISKDTLSLTRVLFGLFLFSELGLIVWLCGSEDLTWVPIVLGACALFATVSMWWPRGGLVALLISSALSRFFVEVNGWNARPDHIVTGFILVAWLTGLPFREHRKHPTVVMTSVDRLVFAYILMNYVSSMFFTPQMSLTLRWALMTNLAVLPYFVVRFLGTRYGYVRRAVGYLLVVGVLVSGYGISCFLLNRAFGTQFGIEAAKYDGGIPGTCGTLYDSNMFGNYTACCSVVFLGLYLFGDDRRRQHYYIAGFLLTAVAMVVSLARASLLAFVVAVLFLMYVAVRRRTVPRRRLLHLAAVGAVLVLTASLLVGTYLRARFGTVGVGEDSSAFARVFMFVGALKDIGQHPLFGTGTGSFHVLFAPEDYFPEMAGQAYNFIENIFLRALHDTGVIGLGILLALMTCIATRVRRLMRDVTTGSDPMLIGLTAAVLIDLVAFQFSDGSSLSFAWIHLGLLGSLIHLLERKGTTSIVVAERMELGPTPGRQLMGNPDGSATMRTEIE